MRAKLWLEKAIVAAVTIGLSAAASISSESLSNPSLSLSNSSAAIASKLCIGAAPNSPDCADDSTNTATTSEVVFVPGNYSVTVFNSDCPCDRTAFRWCTLYRRENISDETCYNITYPSRSMRIYDPLIAADNHILCTGYQGFSCGGIATATFSFSDNLMCVEPAKGDKKNVFRYNSFMCQRASW